VCGTGQAQLELALAQKEAAERKLVKEVRQRYLACSSCARSERACPRSNALRQPCAVACTRMQIAEGHMSRDELLLRLQSDNKELRSERDKLRVDLERFCARR
jgi:hypothetical protein